MDWITKYKPTKLNELMNCEQYLKKMNDWVNNINMMKTCKTIVKPKLSRCGAGRPGRPWKTLKTNLLDTAGWSRSHAFPMFLEHFWSTLGVPGSVSKSLWDLWQPGNPVLAFWVANGHREFLRSKSFWSGKH